jgi:hypothetical protein
MMARGEKPFGMLNDGITDLHPVAENRLRLHHPGRHMKILRPLTGKAEGSRKM